MDAAATKAPNVIQATGLVAMPSKRIHLKPEAPSARPLLVRVDFIGEDGHREGESGVPQQLFLVSPEASWGELLESIDLISDDRYIGGIHQIWVQPDGVRTSPWKNRMPPRFTTGSVADESDPVIGHVGPEGFAMLRQYVWSRSFLAALTFFAAPDSIVKRIAGRTGVDVSSFTTNADVAPDTTVDSAWVARRNEIVEFRSAHNRLPNRRKGADEVRLNRWLEKQHTAFREGRLRTERAGSLAEANLLPKYTPTWDESYRMVEAFVAAHAKLPTRRSDKDLAGWLYNQRCFRSQGRLDDDQSKRLGSFDWFEVAS